MSPLRSLFSAVCLLLEQTFLFSDLLWLFHHSSAVIGSGRVLPELESSIYFAEEGDRNCFCLCHFCFWPAGRRCWRLLGATNGRSQTIFLINLYCATGRNSQGQKYVRFAACSTRVASVADSLAVGSEEGRES